MVKEEEEEIPCPSANDNHMAFFPFLNWEFSEDCQMGCQQMAD